MVTCPKPPHTLRSQAWAPFCPSPLLTSVPVPSPSPRPPGRTSIRKNKLLPWHPTFASPSPGADPHLPHMVLWERWKEAATRCPWGLAGWTPRSRPHFPFPGRAVGVGPRPVPVVPAAEPALSPQGKCSNRPQTRYASPPSCANPALDGGQTKQSQERKCLL